MEISAEIKLHIRTTGFALRKETALKLEFPADPITTKDHCYEFEHRSHNSFYSQVKKMGLKIVMADTPARSPLWDSLFLKNLPRQKEHDQVFPKKNKVVFICPIFDAFPEIISSLICQTHRDWELLLIDDNPAETVCRTLVKVLKDERIKYFKRPREANYGHPHRQWALKELNTLSPDAGFVCVTNGDNYYCPSFLEYMLKGFDNNPSAVACYCSDMIHSYLKWITQPCRLERGHIDCGGAIINKNIACETGWQSMDHSSDWTYFDTIIKKYGADKWVKIPGTLFVHN